MDLSSPYETSNRNRSQSSMGLAYGRITKVYPTKRMCEVKTWGEMPFCDLHLPYVQWLSSDAHPDGDESTVIPRVNSICILGFIGGEPFIIGFFKPLNDAGYANIENGVEEDINEGDKCMTTIAGNKVILRASGEIQLESTDTCKTTLYPKGHLINSLCRNYEFRTDGGTIDWVQYEISGSNVETTLTTEVRDDINRSNIILTAQGTIIKGDPLIFSRQIGSGDPTDETGIVDVVHTTEIKNSGETDVFIRDAGNDNGHKLNIKPSGETTLDIGGKSVTHVLPTGETNLDVNGKATINIKPDGTTTIDVGPGKSTIVMLPSGEITMTTTANMNVSSGADVNIKATGKVKVKAAKIELNGAGSGITTMNGHQGVIDMISGAPIQPSKTVFSDV